MTNKPQGKNPFELATYIDRFPKPIRWLYGDLNGNYFDFKGRCGAARFWLLNLFAFAYLAILLYVCDVFVSTLIVFFMLLLFGWFYIAVATFSIGVRRLHDMGKKGTLAVIPQLGIIYVILLYILEMIPNWAVLSGVFAVVAGAYAAMSMPGEKTANRYGPVPKED